MWNLVCCTALFIIFILKSTLLYKPINYKTDYNESSFLRDLYQGWSFGTAYALFVFLIIKSSMSSSDSMDEL